MIFLVIRFQNTSLSTWNSKKDQVEANQPLAIYCEEKPF